MANNELRVTILADGKTSKVETDEIAEADHVQADRVMKFLAEHLGEAKIEPKVGHAHTHKHDRLKH